MLGFMNAKIIFLCNPKCGTTAVETEFARHAELFTKKDPYWKHIDYTRLQEMFGDYLAKNDFEIFTVVRHPIDVLLSFYHYRSRDQIKGTQRYLGDMAFKVFLERWNEGELKQNISTDFILDDSGEIAPIKYYRYEDVNKFVAYLNGQLGTDVELKKRNVSPKRKIGVSKPEIAKLPRMQRHLEIYDKITFVS